MSNQATLEILVQVRDELAGLRRAQEGLAKTKEEAGKLSTILRQGLGIGSGIAIATAGLSLLRNSLRASVGEAFRLSQEIRDQSTALGMTSEAYQVVRNELQRANLDMGRLTSAITTQNESLVQARSGIGAAAEAYRQLGLDASKVEAMKPEERIIAVAKAVEEASDKTRAFSAAGQILGTRALPQLLHGLRNLSNEGYDKVAAAAKAANRVIGDETVEALAMAKEKIDDFLKSQLPVATATVLGWGQFLLDRAGAGVSNAVNFIAGRPMGELGDLRKPKPRPAITAGGPALAAPERVLAVEIARQEQEAARVTGGAITTEAEKRAELIPILDQQIGLYEKLLSVRFGDAGKSPFVRIGDKDVVTEESLALYEQRNELETKLVAVRQQRLAAVDTPLARMSRELADTTQFVTDTLNNSLLHGINSLSGGIWEVIKGTNSWGNVFRNLGDIAGQVLTEILFKLLIVRPLLTLIGGAIGGPVGAAVGAAATKIVGGGGGTFLTRGPTHFTVGDNPGGVELVSVTPLSGIGQTTINGQAVKMAGGGNLLAAGAAAGIRGGGDTFNFTYQFTGGVSREEILGMMPQMVEGTKRAVLDAQRRRTGGFR